MLAKERLDIANIMIADVQPRPEFATEIKTRLHLVGMLFAAKAANINALWTPTAAPELSAHTTPKRDVVDTKDTQKVKSTSTVKVMLYAGGAVAAATGLFFAGRHVYHNGMPEFSPRDYLPRLPKLK